MPNPQKPKPARVFHFDLYGKREAKYDFLNTESIESIPWKELDCPEPYHFFVPKDFDGMGDYKSFFGISNLFAKNVSGFQTKRDNLTIQFSPSQLQKIKEDFLSLNSETLRVKYSLPEDGRDWKIELAKQDLTENCPSTVLVMYRPFDNRYTLFTGKSKGFVAYPRSEMIEHLMKSDNFSLITCRQQSSFDFQHVFISHLISDMCNISSQTKETGYIFPLYLYPEKSDQQSFNDSDSRQPNLNLQIVEQISEKLGLPFTNEKGVSTGAASGQPISFAPIDLLDYIYAVLHSPIYREKYKEFLKIDFPRVPYPKDAATFWQLVALGSELRQIHLLESQAVNKYITQYPVGGSNVVEKVGYEKGNVYINDNQYFANVPEVAWKFYIGGYQPAQKWLKDRKGRKLEFDDVHHYQKIIVALSETDRIMKEINNIEIE